MASSHSSAALLSPSTSDHLVPGGGAGGAARREQHNSSNSGGESSSNNNGAAAGRQPPRPFVRGRSADAVSVTSQFPDLEEKYGFTPTEISRFKQHFKVFDVDGDGRISHLNLQQLFKRLNVHVTGANVDQLISEVDTNHNGSVEFDEFVMLMWRLKKGGSSNWKKLLRITKPQQATSASNVTLDRVRDATNRFFGLTQEDERQQWEQYSFFERRDVERPPPPSTSIEASAARLARTVSRRATQTIRRIQRRPSNNSLSAQAGEEPNQGQFARGIRRLASMFTLGDDANTTRRPSIASAGSADRRDVAIEMTAGGGRRDDESDHDSDSSFEFYSDSDDEGEDAEEHNRGIGRRPLSPIPRALVTHAHQSQPTSTANLLAGSNVQQASRAASPTSAGPSIASSAGAQLPLSSENVPRPSSSDPSSRGHTPSASRDHIESPTTPSRPDQAHRQRDRHRAQSDARRRVMENVAGVRDISSDLLPLDQTDPVHLSPAHSPAAHTPSVMATPQRAGGPHAVSPPSSPRQQQHMAFVYANERPPSYNELPIETLEPRSDGVDLPDELSRPSQQDGRRRGRRQRGSRRREASSRPQRRMPRRQSMFDLHSEDEAASQNQPRSVLQDPKVRAQLAKVRFHQPWFSITLCVAFTGYLMYALILGNGIQPFGVNIMAGPTISVLVQIGAKFALCARAPYPQELSVLGISSMYDSYPCPPNIPGHNCTYLDTLEYICSVDHAPFMSGVPDQFWRFITPNFLHYGIIHLVIMIIFHVWIGFRIERDLGFIRTMLIWSISGVLGYAIAMVLEPLNITMGSDAAMYGFFGLMYLDLFQNWPLLVHPWRDLVFLTIVFLGAFAIGLLPFIDNFAHLGGFIGGILSGLIFAPTITFGKWDGRRKLFLLISAVPILFGFYFGFFWAFYRLGAPVNCPSCAYFNCVPVGTPWCGTFFGNT